MEFTSLLFPLGLGLKQGKIFIYRSCIRGGSTEHVFTHHLIILVH